MTCIIESNRTWTLLDCSDSGLSVSANVLGIATFAVALLATYFAFFQDVKDIPTAADDYSNDIRSLHDQLWAIGDIHGQLAKLMIDNDIRISDVQLQSRLKQGSNESLKEAQKFLDEYSGAYQDVFTSYFKKHRWFVRLRWLWSQKKVEHFKSNASVLRERLTLDLLAVTLNVNMAMHAELRKRDAQRDTLEEKLDNLTKMMGRISPEPEERVVSPDFSSRGPSPTGGVPVPRFFVTAPSENASEEQLDERPSRGLDVHTSIDRSPSPFSSGPR